MQNRRTPSIVLAQRIGLPVDQKVVKLLDKEYVKRATVIDKKISMQPEVVEFKKKMGYSFNPSAPQQATILFRDILHCPEGFTKSGGYSTDKATLAKLPFRIARLILKYRELTKLHGTYIKMLLCDSPETLVFPDGRLHTQYNQTDTRTGRLSSEDPNLQNIPARTEEGRRIRAAFIAPLGYKIFAADYGQIEPRLIAMASKDKFLLNAIKEHYDIHMDWTKRIAVAYPPVFQKFLRRWRDEKKAWKEMRSDVKSNWVLAGFYGSEKEAMVRRYSLPTRIGYELYEKFHDMFFGVFKWQRQLVKQYDELGYTQLWGGRVRHGPLSINRIINTPIQGWASDVVVNAGDRLSERAERKGDPPLQWVTNTHDELTFFIPKKRIEHYAEIIISSMLKVPFDWVCAPFALTAKVGHSWLDLQEIGDFYTDEL